MPAYDESKEPYHPSHEELEEEDDSIADLGGDDIEEVHLDDDDAPMDSDDDGDGEGDDDFGDQGQMQGDENDDDKMVINDSSIAAFFSHKGNSVFTISLHPQFPQVPLAISGGADDRAFLWSLPGGEEVQALEPKHSDSVIAVGWSHDGKCVATGGMDGMVNVWKVNESSGHPEWNKWDHVVTLEGGEEVQFITWHPKGNVLVAGFADATVWMWNLPSGSVMQVFSGHEEPVTCGKFTPDGRRLLTTSTDGSLFIYDPRQNAPISKLGLGDTRFYSEGGFISLDISPDSKLVAVGSVTGEARIVSLAQIDSGGGFVVVAALQGHKSGESVEGISFIDLLGNQQAASHLVTIATDGKAVVWDIQTQKVRVECVHYDGAYSQDTPSVQTHSNGQHAPTQASANVDDEQAGALTSLVVHGQGPLFTTASSSGTLRTWDARNGSTVAKHEGFLEGVLDADVKPDGAGGWCIVGAGDEGHALVFKC